MADDQYRKHAEEMLRRTASALGLSGLPIEQLGELAAFVIARLGGKSWADAIEAGAAAKAAIVTEDDAERSRRARMEAENAKR